MIQQIQNKGIVSLLIPLIQHLILTSYLNGHDSCSLYSLYFSMIKTCTIFNTTMGIIIIIIMTITPPRSVAEDWLRGHKRVDKLEV